ncbi:hypothetical protein HK100_000677, partial [Physocladia obscura]
MDTLVATLVEKAAGLRTTLAGGGNADEAAVAAAVIVGLADRLKSGAAKAKELADKAHADLVALHAQLADAESRAAILTAQLESTSADLNDTRSSLSGLEEETYTLSKQVSTLSKENRALTKKNIDLEAVLKKEAGTQEILTKEIKEKEDSLRDVIKMQKLPNRESRVSLAPRPSFNRTLSPPTSLSELDRRRSSNIQDDVATRILKAEVVQKEAVIRGLEDQISSLQKTTQEAILRFTQAQTHISTLTSDISELEQENAHLLEETESYNILLQTKTANGKFLSETPLMQKLNSETSLGAEIAAKRRSAGNAEYELEFDLESPNEKKLKSEVKALTLYIEKILSKVMTSQRLEDALVKKEENPYIKDDIDEASTASSRSSQQRINRGSILVSAANAAVELVRSVSQAGQRMSINSGFGSSPSNSGSPVPPMPPIPHIPWFSSSAIAVE